MTPLTSSLAGEPRPVLFLDSGIGGLPYLDLARRSLPGESFAYLADTANFPYGEKSPAQVRRAVLGAARAGIEALRPRAVVVACNTASVVALQSLREAFAPLAFVGTVPAVKPAAQLTRSGRVGVLATRQTVRARYLKDLIRSFAAGCRIALFPAPGVVDFVERRYFDAGAKEREAIADRAARVMKRRRVDVVVLACTHFLHLEDELREALGEGITLVDSRAGVVQQLGRVLAAASPAGDVAATGGVAAAPSGEAPAARARLYVTRLDGAEARYRLFGSRYGMEFCGAIV
jgi:glutamate racemase